MTRGTSSVTRALLVASSLIGVDPINAVAQELRGKVTSRETREPMVGVFVMIRDSAGTRWGAALTDSAGGYHIRSSKAGSFTIVAERIGYESITTPLLQLSPNAVVIQDLTLGVKPILLPEITLGPRDKCGESRESAVRTAQIWDEVRKALTVASWAAEQQLVKYEIMAYSRALERGSKRTLREYVERSTKLKTGTPWLVPNPDSVVRKGFSQPSGAGMIRYHVPGAEVLLSSAFLQSHCFALRDERSRPDQIALTFRPIRFNPRTDVRGTLWLDRRTTVLQRIEYEYVMGQSERTMEGGGAVDYVQFASGVWLATGWRTDLVLRPLFGSDRQERYLLQEGSEVVHALTKDSLSIWKPTRMTLSKEIAVDADSTMEGPAGAPRLPVFSPGATVIQGCFGNVPALGTARPDEYRVEAIVFVGNTQGFPRAGVPVRIAWPAGTGSKPLGSEYDKVSNQLSITTRTDRNGKFVYCGLPVDRAVTVTVGEADTGTREVTLQTRRGVILTRSFLLN